MSLWVSSGNAVLQRARRSSDRACLRPLLSQSQLNSQLITADTFWWQELEAWKAGGLLLSLYQICCGMHLIIASGPKNGERVALIEHQMMIGKKPKHREGQHSSFLTFSSCEDLLPQIMLPSQYAHSSAVPSRVVRISPTRNVHRWMSFLFSWTSSGVHRKPTLSFGRVRSSCMPDKVYLCLGARHEELL